MDDDLRIGLWNGLDIFYWGQGKLHEPLSNSNNEKIKAFFTFLWLDHFKNPIDLIPPYPYMAISEIRGKFFNFKWYEVYDFIEFVANQDIFNSELFMRYCNTIMEREVSGYRFIANTITPVTDQSEINEIEEALHGVQALEPVFIHLKSALDKFSDRQSPDYRNSIKESISAVEAFCNIITGKEKATLGEALKKFNGKISLHPALQDAFSKLYGYTSNADGIRHALLEETKLDSEDAKFMLVACSAFINYLKVKASKANIKF
jgi:hypothetical protein